MDRVALHWVRHGQSQWNVEGRLQGQTEYVPLTECGRRQADEAAQLLPAVDLVISSDLLRARQTAEVIADRFNVRWLVDVALREQGLGDLEGRRVTDLHPEAVPEGSHISEVRWGRGESIQDVYTRVRRFLTGLHLVLEAVDVDRPRSIALVSHGDTIKVALAVVAGRGHREVAWADRIDNGSVHTTVVALPWRHPDAPADDSAGRGEHDQ